MDKLTSLTDVSWTAIFIAKQQKELLAIWKQTDVLLASIEALDGRV